MHRLLVFLSVFLLPLGFVGIASAKDPLTGRTLQEIGCRLPEPSTECKLVLASFMLGSGQVFYYHDKAFKRQLKDDDPDLQWASDRLWNLGVCFDKVGSVAAVSLEVSSYLSNHPELLDQSAGVVIMETLKSRYPWPCIPK